jgi:Flp pilus assembly protein TadD
VKAILRIAAFVLAGSGADCVKGTTDLSLPLPPSNLEWGISLYREGRMEDAAQVLKQATSDDPREVAAWTYLGLALLRGGKIELARAPIEEALRIDPRETEARFALGLYYRLAGNASEAIEALEEAIALNPTHAEAHRELGLACLELDRLDCAVERLSRFLELAPHSRDSDETRELLEELLAEEREVRTRTNSRT